MFLHHNFVEYREIYVEKDSVKGYTVISFEKLVILCQEVGKVGKKSFVPRRMQ